MVDYGLTGIGPALVVHPTRRCNLACGHCYSSSGPAARQTLDLELLAGCVEDAADLGYRQLTVSGGEPLLYRSLGELLARARAAGMLTSVTTNGMLATADRWYRLAPLIDMVAVSIDGTPTEHDAIRRRDGAFATTLRNLETIRASGVPFSFIFTLTQHNVHNLDFVVRLAARYGARAVEVRPLTLSGRAATEMAHARPDEIELTFALFEAARLSRELGIAIQVDAITAEQVIIHRPTLVPERPVRDLVAVAHVLVVDAAANVVPLTPEINPRLALGSLAHSRLAALARDWLSLGRGDTLAEVATRTWAEVTTPPMPHALHWNDEVALRTWPSAVTLRLRDVEHTLRSHAS